MLRPGRPGRGSKTDRPPLSDGDRRSACWSGSVPVTLAPVDGGRDLEEIIGELGRVRGVTGVRPGVVAGRRADVTLSLERPTLLEDELRLVLGGRLLRCRSDGHRLALTLRRPGWAPASSPTSLGDGTADDGG